MKTIVIAIITIKHWYNMERGKLLIMSLLATAFFGSCTNTEEPVTDGTAEAIEVNAGIAEATVR